MAEETTVVQALSNTPNADGSLADALGAWPSSARGTKVTSVNASTAARGLILAGWSNQAIEDYLRAHWPQNWGIKKGYASWYRRELRGNKVESAYLAKGASSTEESASVPTGFSSAVQFANGGLPAQVEALATKLAALQDMLAKEQAKGKALAAALEAYKAVDSNGNAAMQAQVEASSKACTEYQEAYSKTMAQHSAMQAALTAYNAALEVGMSSKAADATAQAAVLETPKQESKGKGKGTKVDKTA